MRSDKSRGLYEALQRSRKGMKRAGDSQAAPSKAVPQQSFPFNPQPSSGSASPDSKAASGSAEERLAASKLPEPAAGQPQPTAGQVDLPLLDEAEKPDETHRYGRDEHPAEHDTTPPSTASASDDKASGGKPVETRSTSYPSGGLGSAGVGFGGGRTAPRTGMAGLRNWKPLILALLAALVAILVLALLVYGLIAAFSGSGDDTGSGGNVVEQPGANNVDDARRQSPQGSVLDRTGPRALEREALEYDTNLPPGAPIGEPETVVSDQHLIPGLSGQYRIAIITSTPEGLRTVQDFMLRQGIPTRVIGNLLVTEQTFPDGGHEQTQEYLERIKSLGDAYSRETRSRTSFESAFPRRF